MMPGILEEMFDLAGRKLSHYLDMRPLDPMYRLVFGDGRYIEPCLDEIKMRVEIERLFPGEGAGFDRYLAREKKSSTDFCLVCKCPTCVCRTTLRRA